MRDLMMAGAMLLLLAFAFRHVVAAYLLWGWLGLIAVQSYLYGFMLTVPYVQIFALITLFLLLFGKDKNRLPFEANAVSILMLAFSVHCLLVAAFAYSWLDNNWGLCTNVLKTVLFCLVMPFLITSRYRFHAVILIVAMGISFHGLLDGLKFIASGGSHRAVGVAKFGDNNQLALTLIMCMPLLIYLYQYSKRSMVRLGFVGVFLVTCLAVVATGSRGGLISLLAMGSWLVLTSRRKLLYTLAAVSVGVLILSVAPQNWMNRMGTIETADQDSSFMGRVVAWKRASAIALDHPLLGGGFHAGQDPLLWAEYRYKQGLLGFVQTQADEVGALATHSIYFEVMGDLGFAGLFWFVILMFYPFLLRRRIRRLAKSLGPPATWAADCSNMLAASMVVFLVGGAALSVAYHEVSYVLVMMMQVLYLLLKRQADALAGQNQPADRKWAGGKVPGIAPPRQSLA